MDEKREEVIGIDVFGSRANAYINDYTIEINLPSWSGRIHSRINGLANLARLKKFISDVEDEINDREARTAITTLASWSPDDGQDDGSNVLNLPTCYACGRPVASDSGVCGVCGADIDINGDMLIDDDETDRLAREQHALSMLAHDAEETTPAADSTGQAWGVIDGQTITEEVVRRLIRQKADAMERARLTGFALGHALQEITRLKLELGGLNTATYYVTPKGLDWLHDNGYDDPPRVGA